MDRQSTYPMRILHRPSTPDHDPLILEPLDVGLPSPFHSPTISRPPSSFPPLPLPSTPSHLPRLSSALFNDNETPTTAVASLPTPGPSPVTLYRPQRRTYADVVRGCGDIDDQPWYSHLNDSSTQLADAVELGSVSRCPPAPKIKDYDSFTDGTGVGSFDFSLLSSQEDLALSQSHLNAKPEPLANTVSPQSIEDWRDTVVTAVSDSRPVAGSCDLETYETQGPRGLKRHLSLTQSDAEDGYDTGAERARDRWATSMAAYNYDYAFLDDATRGHDDGGDQLYYISPDEEAEFVCDEADRPSRPSSAPPGL